ncbi:hypothetical protein QEH56_24550, partial [Pelagicoccus enzymogenes]|uniref:Ig-like domain-containing protein n=1 Tax=Pelagicoccus enzymogenes TaxID=2773457 RepID=UPI00280F68B8
SVYSGPVTATVDTAPWVTISATVSGSDVLLSADGWDPDGITRIGFYYDDGTFIKNDATVPYEHTVVGLAPGPYSFKARLIDGNLDNSLYSSPVVVNVGGSPGSVTLSSSVSGSDVTLTASASDPDGVASVNF